MIKSIKAEVDHWDFNRNSDGKIEMSVRIKLRIPDKRNGKTFYKWLIL
ncbi:hypothetical protein KAR91_03525 [Candidatus Pacearchaeota archaeon]|nr:hypothetical protein [Candidatus Pacearchaeota archaeon]